MIGSTCTIPLPFASSPPHFFFLFCDLSVVSPCRVVPFPPPSPCCCYCEVQQAQVEYRQTRRKTANECVANIPPEFLAAVLQTVAQSDDPIQVVRLARPASFACRCFSVLRPCVPPPPNSMPLVWASPKFSSLLSSRHSPPCLPHCSTCACGSCEPTAKDGSQPRTKMRNREEFGGLARPLASSSPDPFLLCVSRSLSVCLAGWLTVCLCHAVPPSNPAHRV